ncbi:MAG: alpha/beta fold hydrolase [Planctomycetota bacterium]|nr:MAG: alpha/beta fold hydrolase [Planctomycetota bacterium]
MRRAVLILHGILMSPAWNRPLARDLRRLGYDPVLNWGYLPWRRGGIEGIAERTCRRLQRRFPDRLPPLDAVGHSMGGLVLRAMHARGYLPAETRLVTLGSPHQGARRAEVFKDHPLYRLLFGPCGQDLRPCSPFLQSLPDQAPPNCLNLISGRGDEVGFRTRHQGDNDGVVEVQATEWPGARRLFIPDVRHAWLTLHPRTREAVCTYLQPMGASMAPNQQPI